MANKSLSIFIDESGDFGKYEPHASRYIISLVFHDQSIDTSQNIHSFKDHHKMLNQDYLSLNL